MGTNGEKRGRPCPQDAIAALGRARRFILHGKPSPAMNCLDRAAGLIPTDIAAWVDGFLYPAIRLATVYERWSLTRTWILTTRVEVQKRADIGEEQRQELMQELELLRLYAAYLEHRSRSLSGKIDRAYSSLRRWKPWTIDFRWFFLLHEHRLKELGDLVRSPSLCPIRRGTLEYAKRLLYLGFMFTDLGRTDRAVTVLKSSLREFERVPGVESLGQRAVALCLLARAKAQLGDFKQALELMKGGEAIGRRLRRPGFGIIRSQTYSFIHWRAGDYEKALQVNLEFCFGNRRKGPNIVACLAVAFLKAARFALLLGRTDQARRLVSRAARLRSVMENRVVRGCLHLLKGDLERERGTSSGFRTARKHYDLADANFR